MADQLTLTELSEIDGDLIVAVYVFKKKQKEADKPRQVKNHEKTGANGSRQNASDTMTDAQRNYLFRLLAEEGIEGDEAYDHLKSRFKVKKLTDVSKGEASGLIEELVAKKGER